MATPVQPQISLASPAKAQTSQTTLQPTDTRKPSISVTGSSPVIETVVIEQTERKWSAHLYPRPSHTFDMHMGRLPNSTPRLVVENCEIVTVADLARCIELRFRFDTVPTRAGGRRFCLLCPCCGRRVFKLYRPIHGPAFACRACHNLSYTSVQKHDARLDQLLKIPEPDLMRLIAQKKNMVWKLLALKAAAIRLGMISKY